MKRIYAFTLESDEYPSRKFRSNLRLIAFLMYDALYKYDGEYSSPLNINKNIKFNEIYDHHYYQHYLYRDDYSLHYDEYDDKYINFEPLILGDKTFAVTVDDSLISEEEISILIRQSINLAMLDYRYTYTSVSYLSRNSDDERYRKKAVYRLRSDIELVNSAKLVRKRVINNLSNIGKKVGIL